MSSVVPILAREYEQLIEPLPRRQGRARGPLAEDGHADPHRHTRRSSGADRLVNAVAAYDRVGGACIAVDFGTALNYDVVSSAGEYLGGVISPG